MDGGMIRHASVLQDHKVEAHGRGGERGRGTRLDHRPGDVAPADLRAAAVLDDRLVSGKGHQVEHVLRARRFRRRTEPPDSVPVQSVHRPLELPRADELRDDAEHRDAGLGHKLTERPTGRAPDVQGHRRPVHQGRVREPGTHHPSETGRPCQDVGGADVVVQVGVRGGFDRRCMGPRDRLRILGRPGREQDVRRIGGRAGHRIERRFVT